MTMKQSKKARAFTFDSFPRSLDKMLGGLRHSLYKREWFAVLEKIYVTWRAVNSTSPEVYAYGNRWS